MGRGATVAVWLGGAILIGGLGTLGYLVYDLTQSVDSLEAQAATTQAALEDQSATSDELASQMDRVESDVADLTNDQSLGALQRDLDNLKSTVHLIDSTQDDILDFLSNTGAFSSTSRPAGCLPGDYVTWGYGGGLDCAF